MKKAAIIVAAISVSVGFVYAGPEPLSSGKEMKQVAPMPPPCPNWAGFYVGISGGYKFGATDIDLELGGDWNSNAQSRADGDLVEEAANHDLDMSGGELGGVLGYNFLFGNWLIGLEADGGYLWLRDSHQALGGLVDEYNVETSLKTHYLFTFAPRLGYTFCRWMPYITGGLAVGDIDFDQSFITIGSGGLGQSGHDDDAHAGWMVGGGLEYALTDHWHIRAQYQYIDLGEADFDTEFTGLPTFTGHHEAELREHNASFAIMYKF